MRADYRVRALASRCEPEDSKAASRRTYKAGPRHACWLSSTTASPRERVATVSAVLTVGSSSMPNLWSIVPAPDGSLKALGRAGNLRACQTSTCT